MGKKIDREDQWVRVRVNDGCWMGDERYPGQHAQYDRERVIDQIKRHCDDIEDIDFELTYICSFCGAAWTEGDSPHNGGCCDEDVLLMPDEEK